MRSRLPRPCRLLLAVALVGVAFAAHGGTQLYKWVDANGVTHYSDVPEPGAVSVEVGSAQGYGAPAHPTFARSGVARSDASAPGVSYTALTISAPADGAVVWGADGRVGVSAAVEPGLASGHHLWFVLDGQRQPEPANGLSAQLPVPRGTHTIAATITDANGTELISAAGVSFAVRQNSVITPPIGPALPKKRHG